MKKIFFLSLILISNIYILKAQLFDVSSVKHYNLTFYTSRWDQILDSFAVYNIDAMLPAKLTLDTITLDSVGVQYFNNSSYNVSKVKNAIKIETNQYIKGQSLLGYKDIKLSNMYKDPSCVREVLMAEVYRKYMPTGQANFATVTINGTSLGVYINIEPVSDDFLNDNYSTNDNTIVECGEPNVYIAPPAGCTSAFGLLPSSMIYLGTDSMCYQQSYELKSSFGWQDLSNVIHTLNNNTGQLPPLFNIDRALWMLALNNIFVNLDSYTGSGDNYYLFEDKYNVFNVITKNMNRSLGIYAKGGVTGALDLTPTQLTNLSPTWNVTNTNHPLIQKLLSNADYLKRYYAHYRTIYNYYMASGQLYNRAKALQATIDLNAQLDINLLYGYPNFMNNVDQTVVSGKNAYMGIKTLIDARKTYLSTVPEMQYTPPSVSQVTEILNVASSTDTTWITASISNATAVHLGIKYSKYQPYTEISMYDNGLNHDGAAGDGIYGIGIAPQVPNSKVYYYIYAENSTAGKFSPETAAYDYYSYRVEPYEHPAGDIVINEFMADNVSSHADKLGEYDDWIELYNNAATDISLKDYTLSDSRLMPAKWKMPDTTIKANSYLIVWMDEDTLAAGLHANFKLTKNEGEILLSDHTGLLLDSLTYIKQNADTSYGRYPNGTGNYMFMPPSPEAFNLFFNSITKITTADTHPIDVWPNPAKDKITIRTSGLSENTSLIVYSLTQQKLLEKIVDSDQEFVQLNIQDIPAGMYIIRFADTFTKLIKQ